jgi:hypothetical protein
MQEAPARCHNVDVQISLDQPLAEGVGMVRFRRSHWREGGEEEDSHRTGHSQRPAAADMVPRVLPDGGHTSACPTLERTTSRVHVQPL